MDELDQALAATTATAEPEQIDHEANEAALAEAMNEGLAPENDEPYLVPEEGSEEVAAAEPEPETPAPQGEPPSTPDPIKVVEAKLEQLIALQTPAPAPAPQAKTDRQHLAERYAEAIKKENLVAALKEQGYAVTEENLKWAKEQLTTTAQNLDLRYQIEEQQAELARMKAERSEEKLASQLAPAFAAAKVTTLPERAQGLVAHYAKEFVKLGNSPADAVRLALEETGLAEIAASRPAAPPPSKQRRAGAQTIAAQAVAGRATPAPTPARKRDSGSRQSIEDSELAMARALARG